MQYVSSVKTGLLRLTGLKLEFGVKLQSVFNLD